MNLKDGKKMKKVVITLLLVVLLVCGFDSVYSQDYEILEDGSIYIGSRPTTPEEQEYIQEFNNKSLQEQIHTVDNYNTEGLKRSNDFSYTRLGFEPKDIFDYLTEFMKINNYELEIKYSVNFNEEIDSFYLVADLSDDNYLYLILDEDLRVENVQILYYLKDTYEGQTLGRRLIIGVITYLFPEYTHEDTLRFLYTFNEANLVTHEKCVYYFDSLLVVGGEGFDINRGERGERYVSFSFFEAKDGKYVNQ